MTGRMKHPEHGFHHPMPGEAEGMLKNGWTWEEEAAPPIKVSDVIESAMRILDEASPEAPVKRGPGRPKKVS